MDVCGANLEIDTMVTSAGILVFRRTGPEPEFLLAHPGGPFWRNRDGGVWSVPKGLLEPGEAPLDAALREFGEETGLRLTGALTPLEPIRQAGGKVVLCWAVEAELDLALFKSGEFEMEWPPRSGRTARFPEIDRLQYFSAVEALARILPGQAPLIQETLKIALNAEGMSGDRAPAG